MNKIIIGVIGIVAIIIIGYMILPDPIIPTPIEPSKDDKYIWDDVDINPSVRCYTCIGTAWQDLVFTDSVCPDGWVNADEYDDIYNGRENCVNINDMLGNEPAIPSKPAENRVITDSDASPSMPYIYDASHGYLSEKQISQILKDEFNDWFDNPLTSTHCCRHVCMEVETFLEREYGVDVLWISGSRLDNDGNRLWHVWLEILIDDGCFHSFDPTTMEWTLNSKYDISNVYHGNWLYRQYRISYHPLLIDWGTIIPEVIDYHNYCNIPPFESNYADFLMWEFPQLNRDVVLPLSVLQMVTGQYVIGD